MENKLIEKYDNECQNYFNKILPGIKIILEKGRQKYKKQIEFLSHLYLFQNYLLDNQEQYFKEKAANCISTFFSKTASDVLCLHECLNQGQLIPSTSIERNIFESYVNLKLILEKDTINRIKLYEDFEYVQILNRIEEHQKYLKSIEENTNITEDEKNNEGKAFKDLYTDKIIKTTKENNERLKNNYLEGKPLHWAWKIFKDELQKGRNPSLSFICKKLGIESKYLRIYSLNSIVVHSEPLMSNMLIQKGGITPSPNFSEQIKRIAAGSSMLVIYIILLVLEYAKLPKYEEIDSYLNQKWLEVY